MKGVEGIPVYYPASIYRDMEGKQGTAKVRQVLSNVGKRLVFAIELLKAKFFVGGWVNNKILIKSLDKDVERIILKFSHQQQSLKEIDRSTLMHILEDIKGAIELLGKFGASKQPGFVGLAHRVMVLHEALAAKPLTEEALPAEKMKIKKYRHVVLRAKMSSKEFSAQRHKIKIKLSQLNALSPTLEAAKKKLEWAIRKDKLSKATKSKSFQKQHAEVATQKELEFAFENTKIKNTILEKLIELIKRAKMPIKYGEKELLLEGYMNNEQRKAVDLAAIKVFFKTTDLSTSEIDGIVRCVDTAVGAIQSAYSNENSPVSFSDEEGELMRELSVQIQKLRYMEKRTKESSRG